MMVTIDPLDKFENIDNHKLFEACGLIPLFAADAYMDKHDTAEAVYKAMTASYGFGEYRFEGEGSVTGGGTYQYPEDPDLHPLVLLQSPENPVEVFIYQHAILAIRDGDTTIIGRMD